MVTAEYNLLTRRQQWHPYLKTLLLENGLRGSLVLPPSVFDMTETDGGSLSIDCSTHAMHYSNVSIFVSITVKLFVSAVISCAAVMYSFLYYEMYKFVHALLQYHCAFCLVDHSIDNVQTSNTVGSHAAPDHDLQSKGCFTVRLIHSRLLSVQCTA